MSDTSGETRHLGDDLFGDRFQIATTEGILPIDSVRVLKQVNRREPKFERGFWRGTCPVCGREYEVEGGSEDDREDAWQAALDCCGAEWLPPTDWVDDCDICGDSHREKRGCTAIWIREPFPNPESHEYDCSECEWSGEVEDFGNHKGLCPECDSAAVRAIGVSES